jgi:cellulose synthase/poly-beta-1,6-N-acetylglucosamine synthase-like glycosyltransferase
VTSGLEVIEGIAIFLIAVVYGLTLIALSLFNINFFHLVWVAWQHRHDRISAPPLTEFPLVTVQIPIYNERHVAGRVIEAVCRLDWPRDRLEIQVLDDSTDATREIVAQAVAHWRAAGLNIVDVHRAVRSGYKAGALQAGLAAAQGEFVAIFDADFVPPPDFLRRAVPHLVGDARLGFVQARWGHLNHDASLLTMLQSIWIDGHFMVEQFARDRAGYVMNFNGTAGVWRRRAIEDAGGWSAGTLTEDLDLSYRAALRGWRSHLLRDLVAPAELVGEISAYRRQQARWAQGSIECATRLLPQVWCSRLAWRAKVQALFHLTGYAIQLFVLIMSLLFPLMLIALDHSPALRGIYLAGWVFAPLGLVPSLFLLYAQLSVQRRSGWRLIAYLACLTMLGSGMALNSTRAVLRGLRGRAAAFERTPKSGQVGRSRASSGSEYAPPFDRIVLGEIALCLFNLHTAWLAWQAHSWGILWYALLFAVGMAYVAGLSLWQRRQALLRDARLAWLKLARAWRKQNRAARISAPHDVG